MNKIYSLPIFIILMLNPFLQNSFSALKDDKCILFPSIADEDKMNPSEDTEFAVGDDDINNIVEPEVVYTRNSISKKISKLNDYNLLTASRFGLGDCIEYSYDLRNLEESSIEIDKIFYFNGNRKNINEWKKNGRTKKIQMFINGQPTCYLMSADTYKMQTFNIKKIVIKSGKIVKVKFKILQVYNTAQAKDCMISEIMFSGK